MLKEMGVEPNVEFVDLAASSHGATMCKYGRRALGRASIDPVMAALPPVAKYLVGRLGSSRKHDSALFQVVANDVNVLPAVNPRRDRTTDPRLQFATSATKRNKRGAGRLLCIWSSISAKILSEIDRPFVDLQQRVDRSPFGINHVVTFELDVEELHSS
jgi:hypothetical protein